MRKFLLFFLILVLIAGGALAALAYFIPPDVYKQKIEQQASAALGRTVRIEGPVSLRLWPGLQARAATVSLANPPGFSRPDFATMKAMRVRIALLPLLSRRVEVREFTLVEPRLVLERRKNGAVNWMIGTPAPAKPARAVNADRSGGFVRAPGALPLQASLGKVRLVDGAVHFIDHATGARHELDKINLSLSMPSLSAPLTLKGRFDLDGQPYSLTASLGGLKPFMEGARTPLALDLKSPLFSIGFDGAFDASREIAAHGAVRLEVPSVRQLAQAAGTELGGNKAAYGRFSVSGNARANPSSLSFDKAVLHFDQIAATGRFGARFGGATPRLSGRMDIAALDLTPYLPPQAPPGQGVPPWSTEPLDLSMLGAVNADFTLTLGSLQMRQIKIGKSVLKAALNRGRLQADLTQMALYGGNGSGQVVLNGRGRVPSVSLRADIAGVRFLPLLRDAVQFKRLDGTGSARLAVRGAGPSQAAIMKALQGQGSMHLKDGRIIGVNLAEVLRSAQSFLASGALPARLGADKATDFSDLKASFTIANGVARTDDFILLSPLLRVPGQGTLDIGRQTVDFRLKPRAVASLEGQGGKADLQGFEAPFRIHGPWNAVKAGLDTGVLKQRLKKRAKSKLGGLIDQQLGQQSSAGAALKSMLGVPEPAPADKNGARPKSDEEKALDALSGLFKKSKKKKNSPPPK